MKLLKYNQDSENINTMINMESNKEQPINTLFEVGSDREVFLVSAYMFNEFVMLLYAYEHPKLMYNNNQKDFKYMITNRSMFDVVKKNSPHIKFEYEVNHLNPIKGSCEEINNEVWIRGMALPNLPVHDHFELPLIGNTRYSYIYNLIKKRLPSKLQSVDITIKADYLSFNKPITEIKNIVLYPPRRESKRSFLDLNFSLPLGEYEIKIPYSVNGTQSFIIAKKLQTFDKLKIFEKNYNENWRKNWDYHMRTQGLSKEERESNITREIANLQELHAKKILRFSYLKPETTRSFGLYTTSYLNDKQNSFDTTHISSFNPTIDDIKVDGLYKCTQEVGKLRSETDTEHEINLIWVNDIIEHEHKPVLDYRR